MSVTYDAVSNSSALDMTDVNSLTFAHTCTGTHRYLAVLVAGFDSNLADLTVSTITYNSVGLTAVITETGPGTNKNRATLWALPDDVDAASGANNIVVTMAGTCSELGAAGVSAASTVAAMQRGNTATDEGTTDTPTSITISSASGQLCVDGGYFGHNSGTWDLAPVGGSNERADVAITAGSHCAASTEAGAASVEMGWDWSWGNSPEWVQVGMAIKEGTPPAGLSMPILLNMQRRFRL